MEDFRLTTLPSLRRQHLLAEFSGLKQACPEGILVSLTPGDPALWSGAMFIRRGPYKDAILRFQISFPDSYPRLPPLVTFSTDMFHPLLAPLTTYMYTTDIQVSGTVSATDEERLPPGGFSLRHGFPSWFGRGTRGSAAASRQASGTQQMPSTPSRSGGRSADEVATPDSSDVGKPSAAAASGAPARQSSVEPIPATRGGGSISTYQVLRYIRSTFDDEDVLDAVPLEAAGNPGAWHAWKTRQTLRGKGLKDLDEAADSGLQPADAQGEDGQGTEKPKAPAADSETTSSPMKKTAGSSGPAVPAQKPGQWNWEGVWEDRVKKGITASLSEPILYGSAMAADDLIHFLPMEEDDVSVVKDNLLRTLGSAA